MRCVLYISAEECRITIIIQPYHLMHVLVAHLHIARRIYLTCSHEYLTWSWPSETLLHTLASTIMHHMSVVHEYAWGTSEVNATNILHVSGIVRHINMLRWLYLTFWSPYFWGAPTRCSTILSHVRRPDPKGSAITSHMLVPPWRTIISHIRGPLHEAHQHGYYLSYSSHMSAVFGDYIPHMLVAEARLYLACSWHFDAHPNTCLDDYTSHVRGPASEAQAIISHAGGPPYWGTSTHGSTVRSHLGGIEEQSRLSGVLYAQA